MGILSKESYTVRQELNILRGKRLRKLRSMSGLSITDLAKKAKLSRIILSYWENATKTGLSEQGARKILNVIHEQGIFCHFDWLWYGIGKEPSFSHVPSEETHKTEGLTAPLRFILPSIEKEISVFLAENKHAVVCKIDNNQLHPTFEFNDIVAGLLQPTETLYAEKFCIVTLNQSNQVRWVKKIATSHRPNLVQLTLKPLPYKNAQPEELEIKHLAPIVRLWR